MDTRDRNGPTRGFAGFRNLVLRAETPAIVSTGMLGLLAATQAAFMISPALTAILAWPILGQTLSFIQAFGIALTCGGIAWVIAERTTGPGNGKVDPFGLALVIGAAACQAGGALMSRHVFDQVDYGAVPSTLVRISLDIDHDETHCPGSLLYCLSGGNRRGIFSEATSNSIECACPGVRLSQATAKDRR